MSTSTMTEVPGPAPAPPVRRRISARLVMVAAALIVVSLVIGVRAGRAPAVPASPGALRPSIGNVSDVDEADVADPFILTATSGAKTTYYRFGTTDWQSNIPTAESTDLTHWTPIADALPVLPNWAKPSISMTWGPSALHLGSAYVMYFATEEATSGMQCIGRATASEPQGPYRDLSSAPLVCQRSLGGSIDPSVVADGHGGYSLVWKNDGNSTAAADSLWSQQLSQNGLSLVDVSHKLLTADEPWQAGVIEGPAMVAASQGGYWLFYSGGDWRSNTYQTGLAWCPTLAGPCRETANHPWLGTTATLISPGGLEVFTDAKGKLWVALSSFVQVPSTRHPGRFFNNRVLDVAPLLAH